MNVWKIASRWSDTGTKESSVLDIFYKYNLVFAGREIDAIKKKVKQGDLIAISDGKKILSVAKVISLPVPVTNFTMIQDDDKKRFEFSNQVIAFRVEMHNLSKDEIFETRIGTFHAVITHAEKIKKLYENKISESVKFQINTYTYNILDDRPNSTSLLHHGIKYVIPVYQRPYSWGESEIEAFLNDIFISFWGTDKNSTSDSMFIGTMQLSDKKSSDPKSDYQEVIDGQQRITTITLLLKFLCNKYTSNKMLSSLGFDWIDSAVNRGQQSSYLKEVIKLGKYDNTLNKFAQNYHLISDYFESNIQSDENEPTIIFDENTFIDHLLKNLYFVVIETRAGLSKTLQIFKAINTAGLDLNNTDVFKIRLYEYLSKDGDNEDIFDSIDKLYEKIEINNKSLDKNVTDMQGILNIYKYYLISKYDLDITLWKMAAGTFFERLFDTILDIKPWSGFKKSIALDTEKIDKIINIRYIWENKHYGINGNFDDFNTMLSLRLLWSSRYSRYWIIPFLYSMRTDATDDKYNLLIQSLSKLYITYTLLYQKQTNEIHRFTKKISSDIVEGIDIDVIIKNIDEKYISIQSRIITVIEGDIFWNPKIKNILTRMSAAIDENQNNKTIKDIERLIFIEEKIDIEHIKSRNDDDFINDQVLKSQWKNTLNTLGNLVVLEYSINRSIGKNPFNDKIVQYRESKFYSVNKLANMTKWDLNDAQNRKTLELQKIKVFMGIS